MRALLAAALLVAGCGADFDPSSYLAPGKLRVLGVVAEPPQAAPGETVTMTVITPDTDADFEWTICTQPPPPGSSAVDELCLVADMGDFLVPVAGTGPVNQVTMPADVDMTKLGIPDASGGLYVPVRIRATKGDQVLDTVYGLRLTIPQLPVNHNPVIESVQRVVEPLDAMPMDTVELSTDPNDPTPVTSRTQPTFRLTLTDDSYEVYPQITGAPPNVMITMTTEQPRFFWFANTGVFSEDTTGQEFPDTRLQLDDTKHHSSQIGQNVDLWVVVHDDRGGAAFTHRYLTVVP